MKAIFNTKSNYKNCNGIKLEVQECRGARISCFVPYNGFSKSGQPLSQRTCIADFSVKELVELHD